MNYSSAFLFRKAGLLVGASVVWCAAAMTAMAAAPSAANIEQEYRSRDRGHFTVRFEGHRETELAYRALDILEEAYEEVRGRLRVVPADRIEVVIYTGGKYREAVAGPDWSLARYDGKIRVGRADLMAARGTLRDTLYHEYAHALLSAGAGVPAWFHEGVAQYLEPSRPRADNRALTRVAAAGKLVTLSQLESGFLGTANAQAAALAYAQALSMVEFLIAERGEDRLHGTIRQLVEGGEFATIFAATYGERFEGAWRDSLLP
jgi:hypothetical protein